MTKFFNKFRKRCFWPVFGQFSQFFWTKFFFQQIRLCHARFHIKKKLMVQFQENDRRDGRTEGQKDEQTLGPKTSIFWTFLQTQNIIEKHLIFYFISELEWLSCFQKQPFTAFLFKSDSNTGVFLGILQNF